MTLSDWLPNAIFLMVALLFAGHAPREQLRQLLVCWALIAVDWFTYVMSWTPYSIHFGLKAIGLPIHNEDIWCLVDSLIAASVIGAACERPWAWGLWACLAAQVVGHIACQMFGAGFEPYAHFLDLFFWGQLACFILVGGPGVRNRVDYYYHRIRNGLGSRSSAAAAAPSRRRA